MTELLSAPRLLWIIIIVGLLCGLGLGIFVAWMLWPVQVTDVDVPDLKSSSQEDYIILTASSYVYDQDLDKAQSRLAQLKDPSILSRIAALARSLAGDSRPEAAYVAELAVALGNQETSIALIAKTATPTVTLTPRPTSNPTLVPTIKPTATTTPTVTLTPRPRATATPKLAAIPPTVWMPSSLSAWPGGVKYEPTNVGAGQKYWHLSKAIFCDLNDKHDYCQDMPGGGQQEGIWVSLIGPTGARETAPLDVRKPDGTPAGVNDIGPEKSADDMCNCNYAYFANGWPIQVTGAASDKISGLAMNQQYHVRFFITFQLLTR